MFKTTQRKSQLQKMGCQNFFLKQGNIDEKADDLSPTLRSEYEKLSKAT